MLQRTKEVRQDFLGAIHTLTTTLLFGGRYAESFCVANDFEQAQSRVFEAIRRIVLASPMLRREAKISASRRQRRDPCRSVAAANRVGIALLTASSRWRSQHALQSIDMRFCASAR